MGLALAIVMSFLSFVGLSHQKASTHKRMEQVRVQETAIKKKTIKPTAVRPKNQVALLDGVKVRNLKG